VAIVAKVATAKRSQSKSADGAKAPAPVRQRAKRGEGDKLREEILEATADLLEELGSADKVSTRAVAERVGCSSPSIYLHFPDKVSLMYAVCEQQFEKLAACLAEALDGTDDPVERLRAAARAYAHFAMDHPEQYRVMMMDEAYGKMYQEDFVNLANTVGFDIIVQAVQDGIDSGQLAPADPTLVAVSMWAGVHGLVSLLIVKQGLALPPLDELLDNFCHQALEGMRAR
jgi:AcrR family transcriptional regulator